MAPSSHALHAGELVPAYLPANSTANTFHIRAAVEVGHAERIGHGIDINSETDPNGLMDEMAANHVAVEVCLSSNTQILDITYTGSTPDAAHAGSLAFAQAYLDQRAKTATATLATADKALQARIDAATAQLQAVLKASATLPANSPARFRDDAQASVLNNQLAALGSE